MNEIEARKYADEYLLSLEPEGSNCFCFNYDITIECSLGFVYFYNTKQFWETRNFMDSLAGNGPVLITHEGIPIELPANRDVESSIKSLEDRDPD